MAKFIVVGSLKPADLAAGELVDKRTLTVPWPEVADWLKDVALMNSMKVPAGAPSMVHINIATTDEAPRPGYPANPGMGLHQVSSIAFTWVEEDTTITIKGTGDMPLHASVQSYPGIGHYNNGIVPPFAGDINSVLATLVNKGPDANNGWV